MATLRKKRIVAKLICKQYFKDDYDKPLLITDNQADIFNAIFLKENPRVEIITSTQYGKSTICACALIARSQVFKEEWDILAGTDKIAGIIMGKVIQHTFDNPVWSSQLEIDTKEPIERIKRERSKEKITWKCGGSIKRTSAQSISEKKLKFGLAGKGSANILEDEACLIPDSFQQMVIRMLGGHKHNTLIKVGNAIERNHFFETSKSNKYKQIFVDYKTALKEGRYTEEFIEEAKESVSPEFFGMYYECKFPSEAEIDLLGFRRLLSDKEIEEAKRGGQGIGHKGEKRLGFDVGEGGDANVGIIRSDNYAEIVHYSNISDLMATTQEVSHLITKHAVKPEFCFPDDTGIGAGVVDRLHEIKLNVKGIKWAEKSNKDNMLNLKAQNYMDLADWIRKGGKLSNDDRWNELSVIKWITNSQGKIAIKTKEQMRKEGIKSPNVCDALALTFNRSELQDQPRVITI